MSKQIILKNSKEELKKLIENIKNLTGKTQSEIAIGAGYAENSITQILSKGGNVEKTRPLSEHRFNKYRSYLMMLFSEIVEDDAIESNPIRELKKRRPIKKIRQVLSIEERKIIAKHLAPNYPEFWTFVQIFFHSGGRMSELLSIRKEDVSLKNQFYKAVVKKGKLKAEVLRPIKTISLDIWKSILDKANEGDYIFSVGLIPGPKQIRREQITRRWKEHVKVKLGITADIYSLKHSNLDEIARDLSIEAAAAQAGHTTPIVTMKYYAVGEKSRELERLKKAKNEF